jgi:hypothetical protein
MKRYLEWDKKAAEYSLRLVSTHRNLKTGEETESISFFVRTGPPGVQCGGGSVAGATAAAPAPPPSSPGKAKARAVSFGKNAVIDDAEDDRSSDDE